jgi:hypothetical protein
MVPQYFAAPNQALNASINQGLALQKQLAALGITVTGFIVNPIGDVYGIPNLTVAQAAAAGVGPNDLVHLLFSYLGGGQGQTPEVSVIAGLLAPANVSAVIALMNALFGYGPTGFDPSAALGHALNALAELASVASAVEAALSIV